MKKILLIIGLIFSMSQADSFHRNSYVIYQPNKVVTRTAYTNNHLEHYRDNQIVGALLGGVLGGILGHQLGGGSGKVVATVGGAVIGTVVGSNLSHRVRERRVVYIQPQRIKYYRPRPQWRRVVYVDRDRFAERERVVIYRGYR